jgi:hypothetical protein
MAAFLCVAACDGPPEPPQGDTRSAETPTIEVEVPDSGAYIDFQWATASTDDDTLRARLEAYIDRHGPVDGAFEDAVHIRFFRIAQFRLARSYYHAGMLAEGDRMLQSLEETDTSIR